MGDKGALLLHLHVREMRIGYLDDTWRIEYSSYGHGILYWAKAAATLTLHSDEVTSLYLYRCGTVRRTLVMISLDQGRAVHITCTTAQIANSCIIFVSIFNLAQSVIAPATSTLPTSGDGYEASSPRCSPLATMAPKGWHWPLWLQSRYCLQWV